MAYIKIRPVKLIFQTGLTLKVKNNYFLVVSRILWEIGIDVQVDLFLRNGQ